MTSSNTPFQIVPLQNEIDFESNNEIIQELENIGLAAEERKRLKREQEEVGILQKAYEEN